MIKQFMLRWLLLGIVLLTLLGITIHAAAALPPIAAEFYGKVLNYSGTGVAVTLKDPGGTTCGQYTLINNTYYGLLSCRGDDPETIVDEGAVTGETITFFLNDSFTIVNGNVSWEEGVFHEVNITEAHPPFFGNCTGATIEEDGNGSQILIDLHNCSYDSDNTYAELNYSITNQTNETLISCYILSNRYLTCYNPGADLYGNSSIFLRVRDPVSLFDDTNVTINITSVPDAPRFSHNFTPVEVNESSLFFYKVNCTDPDGDNITLASNSSFFPINNATGLINVTPTQSYVGNHSVVISCADANFTTNATLNITVIDINNPPVLATIGPQIASTGELFVLDINATDADGDVLSYSLNTSQFPLDSTTGIMSFIPVIDDIGLYYIRVTVSDGITTDSTVFTLRIVRGPYCGDVACGSSENCESCPTDCGVCPTIAPEPSQSTGAGSGSGTGEGGGGGSSSDAAQMGELCVERWECSEWSFCNTTSVQYRTCRDMSRCGTQFSAPDTQQNCQPETCRDGKLNQDEEGIDCGGSCPPCIFDSCYDGIQNQDEEGIDCGGSCESCFSKYLQIYPILEQPLEFIQVIRAFPWLLLLLALLIVIAAITYDRYYTHKLHEEEFATYQKNMLAYRPWRHRMFLIAFNLAGMLTAIALYLYIYSYSADMIVSRIWILVGLCCIVPFSVSWFLHKYDILDRSIELGLERSRFESALAQNKVFTLEQQSLYDLEQLTTKEILADATNPEVTGNPKFYQLLQDLYKTVSALMKLRIDIIVQVSPKTIIELLEPALKEPGFRHFQHGFADVDLLAQSATRILAAAKQNMYNPQAVEDFMLLLPPIQQDKLYQSQVQSNPSFAKALVALGQLHEQFVSKKNALVAMKRELTQHEMEFIKKYQAESPKIIDSLEGHPLSIHIHNLFVRLYDRYNKNVELLG